ncbi:hypothetical protein MMC27_007374 [Xylographa pallens]|nr:hypothetical protein [Xylographa pallens]
MGSRPANVEVVDLTGEDDRNHLSAERSTARTQGQGLLVSPALAGGQEVRLCNPCVPDPNPLPPPSYPATAFASMIRPDGTQIQQITGSSSNMRNVAPDDWPLRQGTAPGIHRRQPYGMAGRLSSQGSGGSGSRVEEDMVCLTIGGMQPACFEVYNSSGLKLTQPSQPGAANPPRPFEPPHTRRHGIRPPSLPAHEARRFDFQPETLPSSSNPTAQHPRLPSSANPFLPHNTTPYGSAPGSSINPLLQTHLPTHPLHPRSQHRHTASTSSIPSSRPAPSLPPAPIPPEDECPVCHLALPPTGPAGDESAREAHIIACIAANTFSSSSVPRAPIPQSASTTTNTTTTAASTQPSAEPPPPAAAAAATVLRRRATTGMVVYHASEKDCVGESGEPQECVICFEDFAVGDEMGRLECLCKFHKSLGLV